MGLQHRPRQRRHLAVDLGVGQEADVVAASRRGDRAPSAGSACRAPGDRPPSRGWSRPHSGGGATSRCRRSRRRGRARRPAPPGRRARPARRDMAIARSSERPIERNRQPVKRYMFSCTRPEKPVILRRSTLIARAVSSPGVTRSDIFRAVLARSFSAIQPSIEKRSRTLPALTIAEPSMPFSAGGIAVARHRCRARRGSSARWARSGASGSAVSARRMW